MVYLKWGFAALLSLSVMWLVSGRIIPHINFEIFKDLGLIIQFISVFALWITFSALRFLYCLSCIGVEGVRLNTLWSIYGRSFWGMYLLPSSIGIDFVKVYLLRTERNLSVIEMAKCTLIEKISGLLVVVATAITLVLTFLLQGGTFSKSNQFLQQLSVGSVGTFELCLILLCKLVFTVFLTWVFLAIVSARLKLNFGPLHSVAFWIGSMSFVVHTLGMSFYYVIGLKLGFDIGVGFYLLLVPFIFVASALPLTIGGWGLREAFTIFLLSGTNEQVQGAMAGVFAALSAFIALASLLTFLVFKFFYFKK